MLVECSCDIKSNIAKQNILRVEVYLFRVTICFAIFVMILCRSKAKGHFYCVASFCEAALFYFEKIIKHKERCYV